jgi:hypothetical protein
VEKLMFLPLTKRPNKLECLCLALAQTSMIKQGLKRLPGKNTLDYLTSPVTMKKKFLTLATDINVRKMLLYFTGGEQK